MEEASILAAAGKWPAGGEAAAEETMVRRDDKFRVLGQIILGQACNQAVSFL
jgi:hypothetical protein